MTNILANWEQILTFAREYGLPADQKRAIVREFLQAKILSVLYSQKISEKLFFVGGTSLRLLYGLDRFSEDLDFDAPDITKTEIENLLDFVTDVLKKENFEVVLYKNHTSSKNYYELRFPKLLFELGVSNNLAENLSIKFDFESFWKGQKNERVLFKRYGVIANIVTKTLDQFVVEKLVAYLNRKQTLARDLYDLVWLAVQGAKLDKEFALINGYKGDNLVNKAKKKFIGEDLKFLEKRLAKFLLNPSSVGKITFFDKLY